MFTFWGCGVGNRSACAVNRVTDKEQCFIKLTNLLHFIEFNTEKAVVCCKHTVSGTLCWFNSIHTVHYFANDSLKLIRFAVTYS